MLNKCLPHLETLELSGDWPGPAADLIRNIASLGSSSLSTLRWDISCVVDHSLPASIILPASIKNFIVDPPFDQTVPFILDLLSEHAPGLEKWSLLLRGDVDDPLIKSAFRALSPSLLKKLREVTMDMGDFLTWFSGVVPADNRIQKLTLATCGDCNGPHGPESWASPSALHALEELKVVDGTVTLPFFSAIPQKVTTLSLKDQYGDIQIPEREKAAALEILKRISKVAVSIWRKQNAEEQNFWKRIPGNDYRDLSE